MYFVNEQQIMDRLRVLHDLAEGLRTLQAQWRGELLQGFAQERILQLSIEVVTDVGSCLIDGFIMRDASSYEDIVDIIYGEGVFPAELQEDLLALVRLRKPLAQEYYSWPREALHPLTARMPEVLVQFGEAVEWYLAQELGERPR